MIEIRRIAMSCVAFWVFLGVEAQSFLVSTVEEFDDAVSQVEPGGRIVLKNGVWQDAELGFYANGTVSDSITLAAETPGQVVLTGNSILKLAGEYLIVRDFDFNGGASDGAAIISFRRSSSEPANHSRVTNCRIINYNPASDLTEYKWVSLYGMNNRVDHCNFEGKNHEGALLVVWLSGIANHHRIDHNYFADIPELGRNGAETIRIGTSTNSMTESRTIVEHNLFEACDGEIEIISNKSGFNIYRYNTFRDSEGTLTLRHGNDCEVYGNFFFGEDKRSGGVRIIGERHRVYNNYFEGLNGDGFRAALSITNGVPDSPLNRYFQVKEVEVVYNTFVSCKEPIAIGEGKSAELSLPPIDCKIANNVVDQTTGSKAITYTDNPINMSYSSNYINGTIGIPDEGNINADPELELSGDLWRPTASSPLIDNADNTFDYVSEDIDKQSRNGKPDVGSDESSMEPILNAPLAKEDVGFDWTPEDSVITSVDEPVLSQVTFRYSNSNLHFEGVETGSYPIRVILYSLSGQKLFDQEVMEDRVALQIVTERAFIVVLLDQANTILAREKLLLNK